MVQFPDFNKPTKDTFKTNFLEDKFVFKTKTKPNNNLTLSFETSREKGKDYISKLGWNTTFKALDLDFKLDGNVSQVGEVSEELSVKGLYEGLVVSLGGKLLTEREENPALLKGKDEDKKSRDTVSLGFKYAHKHADLSFLVTKKALNPFLIAGALALHYEDVSFGGDISYEVEKEKKVDAPHFKGYNFGATYRPGDLSLTVLVQESLSNALFGVHHKVNDKTTVAFEFKHLLDKKKSEKFEVTSGFTHKIDNESCMKAKLATCGHASVAYQVKVKPELTATVSLETSVKELSNKGKIGLELVYEPLD